MSEDLPADLHPEVHPAEKPVKDATLQSQSYMRELENRTDRTPRQLGPARLQAGEYLRIIYVAMAEMGCELGDILDPSYWAHHASKLKPWDHIEVRAEDGTWYAELLVLDSSRTWAKVHLLVHEKLTSSDTSRAQHERHAAMQAIIADHTVLFRGPRKWSVVRTSSGSVAKEDLDTREAGDRWLREFASLNSPVRT